MGILYWIAEIPGTHLQHYSLWGACLLGKKYSVPLPFVKEMVLDFSSEAFVTRLRFPFPKAVNPCRSNSNKEIWELITSSQQGHIEAMHIRE